MRRCSRCNGYCDSFGLCPDCRRNDNIAEEQQNTAYALANAQEQSQIRLHHDVHLKNVVSKLLDLAIESVEDSTKAEKKVKIIMKSAVFTDNECDFFPEIKSNIFLADCYYRTRLSLKPSLDSIKKLPYYAKEYLPEWGQASEISVYSKKVLNLYEPYRDAEKKRNDKEFKINELKLKIEKAEKEERDKARKLREQVERKRVEEERIRIDKEEQKKVNILGIWGLTIYIFCEILLIPALLNLNDAYSVAMWILCSIFFSFFYFLIFLWVWYIVAVANRKV